MPVEYLGTGNDDGVVMGRSASDKVAFHNATPVAQSASIALATGATIATVVTAVQAIVTALAAKGLTAG